MSLMGLLERFGFGHSQEGFHMPAEGLWIPAQSLYGVTVASIAYAQTGNEPVAGHPVFRITGSGAATAIVDADIAWPGRQPSGGHGAAIKDINVVMSIATLALSGNPTATLQPYSYPAPAAAAAAPAAVGAGYTLAGSGLFAAVTGAGVYGTAQFAASAPTGPTGDFQKLVFRLSLPCQNTTVVDIAGIFVRYQNV